MMISRLQKFSVEFFTEVNFHIYLSFMYTFFISFYKLRCGSTDGAFGPVRNPWKYPKAMTYHEQSSSDSVPKVPRENGPDDANSPTPIAVSTKLKDFTDWHVAGGTSGGSAVAVVTGAAFALVDFLLMPDHYFNR